MMARLIRYSRLFIVVAALAPNQQTPLSKPDKIEFASADSDNLLPLSSLIYCPPHNWHKQIITHWQIGEAGAHQHIETFLDTGISSYAEGRNFPAKAFISRLSPHLHLARFHLPDAGRARLIALGSKIKMPIFSYLNLVGVNSHTACSIITPL